MIQSSLEFLTLAQNVTWIIQKYDFSWKKKKNENNIQKRSQVIPPPLLKGQVTFEGEVLIFNFLFKKIKMN